MRELAPGANGMWHEKYWDAVNQFYWTPRLLGLSSIPRAEWGDDPENITIDRHRITNSGSIYTRKGTSKENAARVRRMEEPLNHIFELTFSIAADPVLARLFHARFGPSDLGPFERLGREVNQRYQWLEANVTQQDALFVSPRSIVGVELKLKSRTWPIQTLKYLALMVLEQVHFERKDNLGLLYITPSSDPQTLWKDCGASTDGKLGSGFVEKCASDELNPTLRKLLESRFGEFQDVAERVTLKHVTWSQFVSECEALAAELDTTQPGDATLQRLLLGFGEAVRTHGGTGFE